VHLLYDDVRCFTLSTNDVSILIFEGARCKPRSISRLMLSLMTTKCAAAGDWQSAGEASHALAPKPETTPKPQTCRKVQFLNYFTHVVGHGDACYVLL
jgi:hypothetical protein